MAKKTQFHLHDHENSAIPLRYRINTIVHTMIVLALPKNTLKNTQLLFPLKKMPKGIH